MSATLDVSENGYLCVFGPVKDLQLVPGITLPSSRYQK